MRPTSSIKIHALHSEFSKRTEKTYVELDEGCVSYDARTMSNADEINSLDEITSNEGSSDSDSSRTTRSIYRQNSETIGINDILMGHRKSSFENIGNRRFRAIIDRNFERYISAITKSAKSRMVYDIVKLIRNSSPPGRFLKFNETSELWEPVSDHVAKERVGQSLRKAFLKKQKIAMKWSYSLEQKEKEKRIYQPNHCENTYSKLFSLQQDILQALRSEMLSSNLGEDENDNFESLGVERQIITASC